MTNETQARIETSERKIRASTPRAKEIVREDSAYKVARAVVDMFLTISFAGAGVVIWWFFAASNQEVWAIVYAASAIAEFILMMIMREVIHAILDIADCALRNVQLLKTIP